MGDELPDWLRGIGDASILRRSRSDIERIGVTRDELDGVAVTIAQALRFGPPPRLTSVSDPAFTFTFDTYDELSTSSP